MTRLAKSVLAGLGVVAFVGSFCINCFAQQPKGKALEQAPGQLKKIDSSQPAQGRALGVKDLNNAADVLNKKMESVQEVPNMTTKTDQASDSGDAALKKKLQDLDTPNPMESTVSDAARSSGAEAGGQIPGRQPVDPRTGVMLPDDPLESRAGEAVMPPDPYESHTGEAAMPPDPLGTITGQAVMPDKPLDAVQAVQLEKMQKINAGQKAIEAQVPAAGR